MADTFAPIALAFLAKNPHGSQDATDKALYAFLADHYPKTDLTEQTVARLFWSIAMLEHRR